MDAGGDLAGRVQCYPVAHRGGGDRLVANEGEMRKPGDRSESVDAMIRVDQAGEYGATRIYQGQLAILGDRHPASRAIHQR